MFKIFMPVIVSLFFVTFAQQQPEEQVSVPKNMLNQSQLQALETKNLQDKIATYGKWVGMGDEIGKAVNGGLKAITDNAVSLSQTTVGKFTMFLIAWKVIGMSLIQFIVGILFAVVFVPLFVWSYWKTCITRRALLDGTKGSEKWEIINDINDDGVKGTRWVHFTVFLIWIAVECLIFFC
jgi:hypothetical protein